MSYYSDIFKIYIQGPKGGVIRMLNAAICHVGMGCKIAERDSIDLHQKNTWSKWQIRPARICHRPDG